MTLNGTKNAICVIGAFCLAVIHVSLSAAEPPGESFVYKEIDGNPLKIYLSKPADFQPTDRRPAIVFFHGGGWVGGAPGQFTEHAAYFASRGLVCFQAQYRLLDKTNNDPPTVCVEDAVSAMRWVRSKSNEFGIDPNRIASAGGSAGGHLAAFVGTLDSADRDAAQAVSSQSNAMLLFNPVYDNGPGGWGTARVGERWPEFSPLHRLNAQSPPSIVFLGSQDALIPVATAERFRDKSLELEIDSELHVYPGQAHGFFNATRDGGKWYYETVTAADRFLSKLGWLEGAPTLSRPVAEHVVLITLDGLRSEEVFGGADRRLMISDLGVKEPEKFAQQYDRESAVERRELLMPFLWKQVAGGGWIAGDVQHDSQVLVTNGKFFSYPGYNELLSGFADPNIDSNAKRYNENQTVLEWLNHQDDLAGHVAAYCSWDVFPFIINDKRSGIPVNAGWSDLTVGNAQRVSALNFAGNNLFHEWEGVRYDAFTAGGAIEHMLVSQPRVLYVSLGETDDWAHGGRYDRYLLAAQQNDYFIEQLWLTAQSIEAYRDKTAFLIATDHGRGDGRDGWKSHGSLLPGSERIWLAAFGAGVAARGIDQAGKFEQAQVAATVAALLGYDFAATDPKIAKPLPIVGSALRASP